jgi:hypothetical protein|eukprot:COSAG02_NODE_292_length_25466_cov_5.070604_8_plen_208_part_00
MESAGAVEADSAEAEPPPRWEWRADWGEAASDEQSWVGYPEHDSHTIEAGFQSGFSPFPIGTRHVVDFDARIQRRLPDPSRPHASSERERRIRRVPDAPFPAVLVVEVRSSPDQVGLSIGLPLALMRCTVVRTSSSLMLARHCSFLLARRCGKMRPESPLRISRLARVEFWTDRTGLIETASRVPPLWTICPHLRVMAGAGLRTAGL